LNPPDRLISSQTQPVQTSSNLSNPDIHLAVVIVNYNLSPDTIDCIHSVLKSDFSPLRIIVVDNGSDDDSINNILGAFPHIEMIELPQNTGFARGYNTGMDYALHVGATHIFILNNDTTVESTAISALLDSKWDVSIPKILFFHNPQVIQSAGARWRPFPPSVVLRGLRQKDSPIYDVPVQLKYASGCAMLIKRSILERLGGFDADYQNYLEDYDFCYRVNACGFKIGYVPEARVYHKDSLTGGKNPKLRSWYIGRNTVLFYRKNQRFPALYLWIFVLWLSLREAVNGNLSRLPDYWQGIRDGFRFLAK
jgi:hypothetical protein